MSGELTESNWAIDCECEFNYINGKRARDHSRVWRPECSKHGTESEWFNTSDMLWFREHESVKKVIAGTFDRV